MKRAVVHWSPRRCDTSRFCCDGRCQQGRDCPLVPRRVPAEPKRRRAPFTLREIACFVIAWTAGVSFVALVFNHS